MIKKLAGKTGMSLMEMMASLLILVLLIVGMNTGMTAGLRVYETSKITTERSMLASSINTKLTDILRYAEVRKVNDKTLYTNLEYGLWDVTFEVPQKNDSRFSANEEGKVQICFWDKTGNNLVKATPLINSSSYSNFKVTDFICHPPGKNPVTNTQYCHISYKLLNTGDNSTSDLIEAVVRIMNE